ncbi:MAG: hypothetical protein ACI82G_001806, partial [Bradymonadia bacterium]
ANPLTRLSSAQSAAPFNPKGDSVALLPLNAYAQGDGVLPLGE